MSFYYPRKGGILRKHTKVVMRQADLPEIEIARFSVETDALAFVDMLEKRRSDHNKIFDASTPEKRMGLFITEVQCLIKKLGLDTETGAPDYLLAEHVGASMKIFMACYKAGLEIALHVEELKKNDHVQELRLNTKAGLDIP